MRKKVSLLIGFALLLAGILLVFRDSATPHGQEQLSTSRTESVDAGTERGAAATLDSPTATETSPPLPSDQPSGTEAPDNGIARENLPASDTEEVPQSGAWIRGYVTDLDARAIVDAEILLGLASNDGGDVRTLSGVDGAFEIGGLAEAQYLIGARHPGYAPAYVRAVASTAASNSVGIVLSRGGSLEGHVTHAGEPVSDCRIKIMHLGDSTSGQTSVRSDAAGFYRIEALTPGAYQLELMLENPAARVDSKPRPVTRLRAISAKVMIEEGRTTRGDFDFSAVTSSVEGQITVDGVAPKKAGITVTLVNEDGDEERRRAEADSDGYYRIEELGYGNAQLLVRAETLEGRIFFTVAPNISIPEWEQVVLNIELLSGSRIAGRVSGVPEDFEAGVLVLSGDVIVEEASFEVLLDLYQTATVVIDPMGSDEFYATGLEPGMYTVLLMAVKQTTSDPFGEIITGNYLVELEEGGEVFIEHSFE